MPKRLLLTLAACLVLTVAALVNVLALQTAPGAGPASAPAAETSAPAPQEGTARPTAVAEDAPETAPTITDLMDLAALPSHVDPGLVRAVQRELASAGYNPGALTGEAGLMTRAAILAFEHDNGLPLTAEPSEALLRKIILGAGKPTGGAKPKAKVEPAAAAIIVRTQQLLAFLGYLKDQASGQLDAATAKAIRKFEVEAGLPETGRVSSALISELARMSRARQHAANELSAP